MKRGFERISLGKGDKSLNGPFKVRSRFGVNGEDVEERDTKRYI